MTPPTCHRCRAALDSFTERTCPECRHELYFELLRYREFLQSDLTRAQAKERRGVVADASIEARRPSES